MGKPDQIGEIQVISALPMGAFQGGGSVIEKTLHHISICIRGTTNIFEFVKRRYIEHSSRTNKSARYICRLVVF